jgi:hypothetical protein
VTARTVESTVRFAHPFIIEGVDRELPAGAYRIVTEEEPIEGLSFLAYRRLSTSIVLQLYLERPISARADRFASVEVVRITPADLARAQRRDENRSSGVG